MDSNTEERTNRISELKHAVASTSAGRHRCQTALPNVVKSPAISESMVYMPVTVGGGVSRESSRPEPGNNPNS